MEAVSDNKKNVERLFENRSLAASIDDSSTQTTPQNIRCKIKNCKITDDKLLEIHHLIPKCIGGTDADGRVRLCKKHHNILQGSVPKFIFELLMDEKLKNEIRQHVKEVSLKWMDEKTQSRFNSGR